jgi:hypothetical protein
MSRIVVFPLQSFHTKNLLISSESGNPASAQAVKEYLKLIRVEQAKSHVLPKQAKPIFLTKVKAISSFIDREIKIVSYQKPSDIWSASCKTFITRFPKESDEYFL